MSNHPYENLREETGAASLQSAPREEEGCLVSLSMPCEAMSSIISVVNDHLAFENSSQKGGDDVATRSLENRARTLPIPELVSDSEDDPADDNVSSDTPTDNGVSSVTMCRICHEGDQEESLVSLCSCSGTMGYLHVSCLEHWLNNKNVDVCELCGQRFPMAAQPSNVLRFFHWVSQGGGRLRRVLLCELLLLATMKVFMCTMFFLVLQVAVSHERDMSVSHEREQESSNQTCYHASILSFISCISIYLYRLMFLRLSDLYNLFLSWRSTHSMRRIVTVPSEKEVPLGRTDRMQECQDYRTSSDIRFASPPLASTQNTDGGD